MNIDETMKNLTLNEKAALVAGTNFMFTNPVNRLGIKSVRMSDGPHGLRVQKEGGDNGVTSSDEATCFPTSATLASSWNETTAAKAGAAIAEEALHYGINVVLGPGTNIKRNPLLGRNFEYFSEDPLLAGKMAASEVKGLQNSGVSACVKHFALNNSENFRFMGDSVCDERAMREIYLKPFELVVKEGKVNNVMCAYNKINGTYCCQNKWLLTDLLRDEWGFDGLVMTDWGATHDRLKMLVCGCDLEMPGDTDICRKIIVDGVKNGALKESVIDKAVKNVLLLASRHENQKKKTADFKAHHLLAEEIASDSAVLMKNDGALPLKKEENLLIVGELFKKMRYQGAGSSMINPKFLSTPETAFDEKGVNYRYVKGYSENRVDTENDLISEATSAAENYEKVLVFAGLTDYVESEGCDRENMKLPQNQLALIDALIKQGKKIILVLFGGSPMELPFAENVSAILDMYLPGQNGGNATYNLLFGYKTPSGKLAETWAESYEDVPFGKDYGKSINEIYKESVFVGYRYYLTANRKVRYPFGFGLSYTTFDYADMKITEQDDEIKVTAKITNTGNFDGAEVVQLYVKAPVTDVFKPLKELKGFTKVYLEKGKTEEIEIIVKKSDLSYYNVSEKRFVSESGEYVFELCENCLSSKLSETLYIKGEDLPSPYSNEVTDVYSKANLGKVCDRLFEDMSGLKIPPVPPKKPLTLDSRFSDMTSTFTGKILHAAVLSVAKKQLRKAKKLPDGAEKDNMIKGALFLERILESNSLITMSMSAGKSCPFNFANGFMNVANGKIFKGAKDFLTPIKAPALPKDEQ